MEKMIEQEDNEEDSNTNSQDANNGQVTWVTDEVNDRK